MSGGVDSSVAVDVLKRAGYEVVGVTCIFQDNEKSHNAARDAACVCERMGITHQVVQCASVFDEKVIAAFVHDYATGLTPSPCVGCNAHMKFPALIDAADKLDCFCVATGHYARVTQTSSGRYAIKRALDARKDQSYMLCLLTQEQLSRVIFPLGGMTKTEVRLRASELGLEVAEKPESQDVCFIEGNYRDFLSARGVEDAPGLIVDTAGKELGRHRGLFNYTAGQRKGIGIASSEPYYVIEKRPQDNTVVVGYARDALISSAVVENINWQAIAGIDEAASTDDLPTDDAHAAGAPARNSHAAPQEFMVKLRYRSAGAACTLARTRDGRYEVCLQTPQQATAPGQFAVFYRGDTLIGGGMIVEVGK